MPVLPYDTAIDKHLCPGERLRWVGRPRQGWAYRWSNRLLFLQVGAAILCLIWLARFANWCASAAGMNLGLQWRPPTLGSSVIVILFVGVLAWQLIAERRRRAGTWYAITDRRILFVLTSVRPESVIGVEFGNLAQISFNNAMDVPGPLGAIVLKLKQGDVYLANSSVLGYQPRSQTILLEDLEDPREFYDQLLSRRRTDPESDDGTLTSPESTLP